MIKCIIHIHPILMNSQALNPKNSFKLVGVDNSDDLRRQSYFVDLLMATSIFRARNYFSVTKLPISYKLKDERCCVAAAPTTYAVIKSVQK